MRDGGLKIESGLELFTLSVTQNTFAYDLALREPISKKLPALISRCYKTFITQYMSISIYKIKYPDSCLLQSINVNISL